MILLTFVDIGRTRTQAKADEYELMSRKPGQPYTNKNDDKISRELFTIGELELFYKETKTWTREMARLLLEWANKVISVN
jgi:hypothetical protein